MSNQRVTPRSTRLAAPKQAVRSLDERGKMLFVNDVVDLLCHRKSAWWVRNRFAPEYRQKLGRDPFWWERDALAWLDREAA